MHRLGNLTALLVLGIAGCAPQSDETAAPSSAPALEDGSVNEELVGSWSKIDETSEQIFVFSEDGTMSLTTNVEVRTDPNAEQTTAMGGDRSGKWADANGVLVLQYDDTGRSTAYEWNIDGDDLSLVVFDGDRETIYTRSEVIEVIEATEDSDANE